MRCVCCRLTAERGSESREQKTSLQTPATPGVPCLWSLMAWGPLGALETPREWLRGLIRTFSKSVSPVVAKSIQSWGTSWVGARLNPQTASCQLHFKLWLLLRGALFLPRLSQTLQCSGWFQLQPNLAPVSHTVFFPEARERLAGMNTS